MRAAEGDSVKRILSWWRRYQAACERNKEYVAQEAKSW